MTPPEEPLELSAPVARRLAPELCRRDPATGESCAWSHGLWQYLRLLGLVTTPVHHRDFLRPAFEALARPGSPLRVLVSGSADYGMLAQVLAAYRGPDTEITVLDICETPLALNRWYAERIAQRIETHCGDILEYIAEPFDIICTHAFLAMFPAENRPALLAKWRELLRPGGVAITVNRLRPGAASAAVGFGEDEVRSFREAVRTRASPMRGKLSIDPDRLAREAELYARRQRAFAVRSADEVRELFEEAGFRIEHVSCAPIERGSQSQIAAPTVPGSAEYVRVIATRL